MKNLFFGLCALIFLMGVVSTATGSPAVAYGVGAIVLIGSFVQKPVGVVYSKIDPDVTALTGWAAKHEKKILTKFENALDFFKDLAAYYNIKSETKLTKLAVNGKPRPFTGIFSPIKGDIVYSDQTINVHKWQRDFQIMPDNYRNTYLQAVRGAGEGANNMKFADHVYDAVLKTLAGNINDVVPWWGVGEDAYAAFNPASTYADGDRVKYAVNDVDEYFLVIDDTTAGQTPVSHPAKFRNETIKAIAEGLGVKLRKARTAGTLTNVASTGAITKADAYEQLHAVWAKAPEWLRKSGGVMKISFSVFELLLHSFEDISKYTEKDGTLTYLPLTNKKCKLEPASWITDSDMVVVSTKDNLIAATDLESDYRTIRLIPQMYHLDFGITGMLGFGIQDLDAVAVNDRN